MSFGGFLNSSSSGGGEDGAPPDAPYLGGMPPGALSQRFAPPSFNGKSIFSSPGLSLALQTGMEGNQGDLTTRVSENFSNGGSRRSREDEHESRSVGDNMEGGASADEQDASDNPRKKKKYHRHTPQQIQELESVFKECPHPDEKQMLELSKRLCLETIQVKFWFQNRRTQMKTQLERHENSILRQENDKLRAENMSIREAVRNPMCTNCGFWTRSTSSYRSKMGSSTLLPSKRGPKHWTLLDLVTAAFFGIVFLFFILVFTPLGDSLAACGRRTLLRSTADPGEHLKLVAMVESGRQTAVEACPAEYVDYMPREDPKLNSQLSREMNFYREQHCPPPEETPLCLNPPPKGYKISVPWPESLHKIWHGNVPYDKIADRKGHQGWMKKEGPYFIFPGGGTMSPDGAVQYIEKLGQYIPISGGVIRTALDMGCGVASFGGYLLSEDIMTVSFAPRDSHKAQIQFALERGLPAFVAMLGTRRLPFPAFSFDLVHCSRCLIPFTAYNSTYFIEVDRLLRPGGYLVISGPPVQWPKQDKEWADLQATARGLCYELIAVDGNTVVWKKPTGDSCLSNQNELGFQLCDESEDSSYAWYYKLKRCVSRTSDVKGDLGVGPVGNISKWPERLVKAPRRAVQLKNGFDVFKADTKRWTRRVAYYKKSLNVKLGTPSIRNVMDMNAFLGGFAASITSDSVWVMNVVPPRKPLTLGVIYDRGLIGVYHDWCEPFSTYPRTYDLLHVVDIESLLEDAVSGKNRCNLVDLMVEMDRILRPEGTVIVRDSPEAIEKVNRVAHAIRWTTSVHEKEPESSGRERILVAKKTFWKL